MGLGDRMPDETHPNLIPYEELPESEKSYDRGTATETLKAILLLGSSITPASDRPRGFAREIRARRPGARIPGNVGLDRGRVTRSSAATAKGGLTLS